MGMRFTGFKTDGLNLEQMRGLEGLWMKEIYEKYADENNVIWSGRKYKTGDIKSQDIVNQYITICNQFLYNICRAAIYTLGYSPAIGFIHTGHMDSFVYDIVDLYKADIVIPITFTLAKDNLPNYKKMREVCFQKMQEIKLLSKIQKDIDKLFPYQINSKAGLWNEDSIVDAGINYDNQ